MTSHRGTFMMERPAPKSSESDPPAANQPIDVTDPDPKPSDSPVGDKEPVTPRPQIVPGKPDGEVDTRA